MLRYIEVPNTPTQISLLLTKIAKIKQNFQNSYHRFRFSRFLVSVLHGVIKVSSRRESKYKILSNVNIMKNF